ncbi:hypothetical protein [Enterobacter sp. 638]|uniref:hypothetical protein n=1 Tax=Enterobacter sp. (strain 638) TaxID=399742 RepID=UPI00167F5E63|nr:hypothetical protein [Enterobacter sp. 638]
MKILLMIIMLNSGSVTVINYDDASACMSAKNELRELISNNAARVTCIIQK